jgi:hypothetical protein
MKTIVSFSLSVLIFLISGCMIQKNISCKDANSSLDIVKDHIYKIHPDPNFNVSRATTDSIFRLIKNENLTKSVISKQDLVFQIAEYISSFKDGHLRIFPNTLNEISNIIFGRCFPLDLIISDTSMIIENNYTGCIDLMKGSKIISINNENSRQFLGKLKSKIPSENDKLKNKILSAYFPYQYWLIGKGYKKYRIVFVNSKNDTSEVELDGIKYRKYLKLSHKIRLEEYKRYFQSGRGTFIIEDSAQYLKGKLPDSYFYSNSNVAYLRIKSFTGSARQSVFFKESMANAIRENASCLIIDLRNNRGGRSTHFSEILGFIPKDTIYQINSVVMRVDKNLLSIAAEDMKRRDSTLYSKVRFKSLGDTIVFNQNDFLIINKNKDRSTFNGKLIVWVDAGTFSAASSFVAIIKNNKIGFIAGEETGGFTNSFGDPITLKIPKTQWILSIPTKLILQDDYSAHHGVTPDIPLVIEDNLQEDIDTTISTVIKSIKINTDIQ